MPKCRANRAARLKRRRRHELRLRRIAYVRHVKAFYAFEFTRYTNRLAAMRAQFAVDVLAPMFEEWYSQTYPGLPIPHLEVNWERFGIPAEIVGEPADYNYASLFTRWP